MIFQPLHQHNRQRTLLILRHHWLALAHPLLSGFSIAIGAAALFALLVYLTLHIAIFILLATTISLASTGLLIRFTIYPIADWWYFQLTFDLNLNCIIVRRLRGLQRTRPRFSLDGRQVNVSQAFWERPLNCGSLSIYASGYTEHFHLLTPFDQLWELSQL